MVMRKLGRATIVSTRVGACFDELASAVFVGSSAVLDELRCKLNGESGCSDIGREFDAFEYPWPPMDGGIIFSLLILESRVLSLANVGTQAVVEAVAGAERSE